MTLRQNRETQRERERERERETERERQRETDRQTDRQRPRVVCPGRLWTSHTRSWRTPSSWHACPPVCAAVRPPQLSVVEPPPPRAPSPHVLPGRVSAAAAGTASPSVAAAPHSYTPIRIVWKKTYAIKQKKTVKSHVFGFWKKTLKTYKNVKVHVKF